MIQVSIMPDKNARITSSAKINHPQANLLNVKIGHQDHCHFPFDVELNFQMGSHILTDIIPDFSRYAVLTHDDRVMSYHYVPLAQVAKFLSIYGEKNH